MPTSEVPTLNGQCGLHEPNGPDPACGYLHKDNRHRDMFHRRNSYWDCNRQSDADHVAASNIKSRIDDRKIRRFAPNGEVKKIADERFLGRMESRNATARGRTPSRGRQRKLDPGGGDPPTHFGSVSMDRTEGTEMAGERREMESL